MIPLRLSTWSSPAGSRSHKVGPDGREQILAILGEGQIFGDIPAFDGGPYPATAATMIDSEIYLLRSGDFRTWFAAIPK